MRRGLWDDMVRSLTETAKRFPRRLCSVDRMVEDGTIYTISVNPQYDPVPTKVLTREEAKWANWLESQSNKDFHVGWKEGYEACERCEDNKEDDLPSSSFVGYVDSASGFPIQALSSVTFRVLENPESILANDMIYMMTSFRRVRVTIQALEKED